MLIITLFREKILHDDNHGEFHYPLTPVIATLTLLVGNKKYFAMQHL